MQRDKKLTIKRIYTQQKQGTMVERMEYSEDKWKLKKQLTGNSITEKDNYLRFQNSLDGLNFRLHTAEENSTEMKRGQSD